MFFSRYLKRNSCLAQLVNILFIFLCGLCCFKNQFLNKDENLNGGKRTIWLDLIRAGMFSAPAMLPHVNEACANFHKLNLLLH